MHVRSFLLAVAAVLVLASAAAAPARRSPASPVSLPATVRAAGAAIAWPAIRADIAVLADDSLEGRGTGTRGYDLAARYVAGQMAAAGLAPAGTDGFLAPVPFRRADLDRDASSLALVREGRRVELPLGSLAVLAPDFLRERWTTDAPLAFVGFGVSAPELDYDDFAGIDVRGKVLVEFRGAPPRFGHDERAYYSTNAVKEQAAAAHGAIGILTARRPADERAFAWEKLARASQAAAFHWTDEAGAPAHEQATLELMGTLSRAAAESAFAGAPVSYEQALAAADSSQPQAFALPAAVHGHRVTRHAAVTSPNVVGLLRGSDPVLARQAVVLTAHLDHLGIGVPVNGDSIHNGAYDNASGTALMLAVARAVGALRVHPRRTLLFVAVTGEEKGLQGSDYFASHPAPESLEVVADLNLDEVLMLEPVTIVIGFGAEHSTLGPVLERAAALCGMRTVPDPVPAQVVFVRSDQFSFVHAGIPALYPVSAMSGTARSDSLFGTWDAVRYHMPSDDLSQVFDGPSAERFARMMLDLAWMVADARDKPRWNEGDFFARRFGPAR